MSKFHYVYRITNTIERKHYYGVRTSKVEPKLDLGFKYFSSSTDKEFIQEQKSHPEKFKYKIVLKFSTRVEATGFEIKLHHKFDVGVNESFYNKSKQTSTGFDTYGIKLTPEQLKKWSDVKKGFKHSDETKRKLSVKLTEYVRTEEHQLKLNNARRTDEARKRSSETKLGCLNGNSTPVAVYNSYGELVFHCFSNFNKLCSTHNLPFDMLVRSYRCDGEPIYQDLSRTSVVSRLENNGNIKYVGWYAKSF